MKYSIRKGTPADASEIEALLPRLADFEVPGHRVPEDLWLGDKAMMQQWSKGNRPDVDVAVAIVDNGVVGIAIISEKAEMLSGQPSVHLETIAIAANMEGNGIGAALMQETEKMAIERGATCISLHVFSANTRARALYERHGFTGELMRYYKSIE